MDKIGHQNLHDIARMYDMLRVHYRTATTWTKHFVGNLISGCPNLVVAVPTPVAHDFVVLIASCGQVGMAAMFLSHIVATCLTQY